MWLWSILEEIYLSFALFILITSFIRFKNENTKATIVRFNNIATIALLVTSIVYIIIWLTQVYQYFYLEHSEEEKIATINRMMGPYWFAYWMYPFSYALFPQLFWSKKLRRNKAVRVIAACLLLFVLYFEKAIILATSLHRDYL